MLKLFLTLVALLVIPNFSIATEYFPEVVMTNPNLVAACPKEDDVWGFNEAIAEQSEARIKYYVRQINCLPIITESHGAVIDASPTMLKVRWNYLHKYPSQTRPELWVLPRNLRNIRDRNQTVYELLKQ